MKEFNEIFIKACNDYEGLNYLGDKTELYFKVLDEHDNCFFEVDDKNNCRPNPTWVKQFEEAEIPLSKKNTIMVLGASNEKYIKIILKKNDFDKLYKIIKNNEVKNNEEN